VLTYKVEDDGWELVFRRGQPYRPWMMHQIVWSDVRATYSRTANRLNTPLPQRNTHEAALTTLASVATRLNFAWGYSGQWSSEWVPCNARRATLAH
jgi:hypothetical protein